MINLEHKLTVDDLIVEYMIYKTYHGYEPSFTTSEFISFLHFFEIKMSVEDVLYDKDRLFKRFIARKNANDWDNIPHMDLIEEKDPNDLLIQANYKLSSFDKSIINTYFMDNGLSRYDNYQGEAFRIRKIIKEYLENMPKRVIDETITINDNDLIIGKYFAAQIIQIIWKSYTDILIENRKWPSQCRDINKYLLTTDLSAIINSNSIKQELLELYAVITKRIAIMYHQDKNLRINSTYNSYLARANYELLIQGYENLFNMAFKNNEPLVIDLSKQPFSKYQASDITTYMSNNVLKLVKELDKQDL